MEPGGNDIQCTRPRHAAVGAGLLAALAGWASPLMAGPAEAAGVALSADPATGHYTLRTPEGDVLTAGVAVRIGGRWLDDTAYPAHRIDAAATAPGEPGNRLVIVHSGAGLPELTVTLRAQADSGAVEIGLSARNTGRRVVQVQGLRPLVVAASGLTLAGAHGAMRVLSDSYSEDRPILRVHELGDEGAVHRAVGSQLLYDRASGRSLFVGALRSARWLTILRLHVAQGAVAGLEAESTGTTELARENSLEHSPPADAVELRLPLPPGARLEAEPLRVQVGPDPHALLEAYGDEIRERLHARVGAPTPLGWWSWTAYYFGIDEGSALANASALARHLRGLGYRYFHVDEGYQYARGDYATPDAARFPHGMRAFESQVGAQGLLPGLWTAPFEVSERSWVYAHHKEWLVRNEAGQPIHLGLVDREDQLYALDPTHPGAQEYLRRTYRTLTRDWGVRYIKLDFMEDSAVEGRHFRPHATALEAQRIGLEVIREAVGDGVLLDKDGSPMLNPVGIVDTGRISVDTSHDYGDVRLAAGGVAARYYMNRRFFINDPDAFMVSRQVVGDVHEPLSLDEARSSIVLAAVGGGMYQIGDDLPTLLRDADRRALVENAELLRMARWGRAATPLDLMDFPEAQGRASLYLLREGERRAMVALFNWSDGPSVRELGAGAGADAGAAPAAFGLPGRWRATDVLEGGEVAGWGTPAFPLAQPPHSVRLWRLDRLDGSAPMRQAAIDGPSRVAVGEVATYRAVVDEPATVVAFHWDFGDGSGDEGERVQHESTVAGHAAVTLHVERIDGADEQARLEVESTGQVDPAFRPARNRRYAGD